MRKRVFLLVCSLLMLTMVSRGLGGTAQDHGRVGLRNSPTPPVDRSLTDYATKLIIDRTGVDCEWPLYPQDWTATQFWQAVTAAGTMPNVLDVGAMWVDTDYATFITKNNLIWPITAAMIKQYMPNYTARMRSTA